MNNCSPSYQCVTQGHSLLLAEMDGGLNEYIICL